MEETKSHAPLNPSGCALYFKCPKALHYSKIAPKTENEIAKRGTAFHSVMEQYIKERESLLLFSSKLCTAAGAMVDEYLTDNYEVHSEKRVYFGKSLGCPDEYAFGTADVIAYDKERKHLVIADFKFGYNAVEVKGNTQLMLYAVGALNDYPDAETVELVIIQPTVSNKASKYTVTVDEVKSYINKIPDEIKRDLLAYVALGEQVVENIAMIPGSHCIEKYCAGRKECEGHHSYIMQMVDLV